MNGSSIFYWQTQQHWSAASRTSLITMISLHPRRRAGKYCMIDPNSSIIIRHSIENCTLSSTRKDTNGTFNTKIEIEICYTTQKKNTKNLKKYSQKCTHKNQFLTKSTWRARREVKSIWCFFRSQLHLWNMPSNDSDIFNSNKKGH